MLNSIHFKRAEEGNSFHIGNSSLSRDNTVFKVSLIAGFFFLCIGLLSPYYEGAALLLTLGISISLLSIMFLVLQVRRTVPYIYTPPTVIPTTTYIPTYIPTRWNQRHTPSSPTTFPPAFNPAYQPHATFGSDSPTFVPTSLSSPSYSSTTFTRPPNQNPIDTPPARATFSHPASTTIHAGFGSRHPVATTTNHSTVTPSAPPIPSAPPNRDNFPTSETHVGFGSRRNRSS